MHAAITRKRLTKDSVWSISNAIANSLFGIAYIVLIGNIWGSSGLGTFSISLSIYFIGAIVFNLGVHNAVLYFVSSSIETETAASAYTFSAILSSFILGILGGVTGLLLSSFFSIIFHQPQIQTMVMIFSLGFPFFLVNKSILGIFNAYRSMHLLAFADILRGSITLLFLGIAIFTEKPVSSVPLAFIASEFLTCAVLFSSYLRVTKPSFSFPHVWQLISFGWKAALSGIIGDINTRIDILIIGLFWNSSVVGFYTVSAAIARGVLIIPSAVQRVTNPLIVHLFSTNQIQKLHRTIDVLYRLCTVFSTVIGLILIFIINWLLSILYPHQPSMLGATIPFYFLIPGILIFSGISIIGTAPSSSIGRPENALKINLFIMLINLFLNIILVPYYAATGAGLATSISFFGGVLIFWYYTRQSLQFNIGIIQLFIIFIFIYVSNVLYINFTGSINPILISSSLLITITFLFYLLDILRISDFNLLKSIMATGFSTR